MALDLDALTRYWREISISRALNRVEPPAPVPVLSREDQDDDGGAWVAPFTFAQFLTGYVPTEFIAALRDDWERRHRRSIDQEKRPPVFAVHFAPFAIDTAAGDERFHPLLGAMIVTKDGQLFPDPDQVDFPPPLWIPRAHFGLENAAIPEALKFPNFGGYVEAVMQAGGTISWESILHAFAQTWRAAVGVEFNPWVSALPATCQFVDGWIREGSATQFASSIIWAYSEIIRRMETRKTPALYRALVNESAAAPPPTISEKHIGVFDGSHGLLSGQRTCAHAAASLKSGTILAVNGPPGTGKTTLSQTVVANTIINAALERDRPALILAAAATNQAITNVLESFARVQQPCEHPFYQRWLEWWRPYGVYAKASRRRARAWPFPMVLFDPFDFFAFLEENDAKFYKVWTGRQDFNRETFDQDVHELLSAFTADGREIPASLLFAQMRSKGPAYWLSCARIALGQSSLESVSEAMDQLHKLLRDAVRGVQMIVASVAAEHAEDDVVQLIASTISDILGGDAIAWKPFAAARFEEECRIRSADERRDALLAVGEALLGATATSLAMRIAEGRFMEAIQNGGVLECADRAEQRDALHMLANLSPCIVATFDRLPRIARAWDIRGGEWRLAFEVADLILIDEAGQAAPDKAAYAFALGVRAVIVGDNQQLPPVEENDAPYFDEIIADRCGVGTAEYVARHLLCNVATAQAPSSIMHVASNASAISAGERTGPGLWLYDHFRCEEPIIAFSSKLWYGNKLRCRVHTRSAVELYPLVYVPTFGEDARSRRSRVNLYEAEGIAEWIATYGDYLVAQCGKPLADVVAVVTPFVAQAHAVSRAIARIVPGESQRIVVGTVHTLQGAERDVVILSTVYAPRDGVPYTSFFDSQPRLVNVGVTRARRSLVVVGHPNALRNARPGTVMAHLREHLIERGAATSDEIGRMQQTA
jgi:hypothetical protein